MCCVQFVAVMELGKVLFLSREKLKLFLIRVDGSIGGGRELRMGSGRQSEVLLSMSMLGFVVLEGNF